MVIWVTGMSRAGKTTLCNALWTKLKPNLPTLVTLDGDLIRKVFGQGLGYREEDRVIQITRMQSLAKMLSDQGLVVMVAALYANPELLAWNRQNINGYFEVYLEASVEVLRQRDSNGLYQGAIDGTVNDVVGVDIPWHVPQTPDLTVNTDNPEKPEVLAQRVIAAIPALGKAQEPH